MHLSIKEYGSKHQWKGLNPNLVEKISTKWKKTLGIRVDPFVLFYEQNKYFLKSSGVTGFVSIDKINIEIKPKFLEDVNCSSFWRQILWNILIFNSGKNSAILSESLVAKAQNNTIIDLIGWIFLEELKKLKLHNLPRGYKTKEENLNFQRGKIDFRKIIDIIQKPHMLPCIYDEYTEDIFVNQVFKWACNTLSNTVESLYLSTLLNQELVQFKDISIDLLPSLERCKRIKLPTQYEHANNLLSIVILLLENHNVEYNFGQYKNFGFLWNSHKVYEDFIYGLLKNSINMFSLKTELIREKEKIIATAVDNTNVITQKPDYLIKQNGQTKFVLDAKYKYLEYNHSRNKYKNPKKEDINQIIVACKFENCRHGILVYPGNSQTETSLYKLEVQNSIYPEYIYVMYVDLEQMYNYINHNNLSKEIYTHLISIA